jgi:hypothetical protein
MRRACVQGRMQAFSLFSCQNSVEVVIGFVILAQRRALERNAAENPLRAGPGQNLRVQHGIRHRLRFSSNRTTISGEAATTNIVIQYRNFMTFSFRQSSCQNKS